MGGDHRTHGLVKEFPAEGHTVSRYCQGGSPAMYKSFDLRRHVEIDEGYDEYRHLNPLHEVSKSLMLLGYPNLLAHQTLRVASDGLDRLIKGADAVLTREPWQMPYVLDNAPADTPVIFSSHNVETERFADIEQPLFANSVQRKIDQLERRSVEETDAIVCTSQTDAAVYRERYDPGGPVLVAPNGTYVDSLRKHRPESQRAGHIRSLYGITTEETVCLFMGSNYKPNVEAARELVGIAREMNSGEERAHFIIMGSVGNALNEKSLPSNVTTTGYVEDRFEAHFDAADIALNPMISGGGTNIKLIDYFARSLPVVSTPFGARGFDAEHGEVMLVSELAEFPRVITSLGSDHDRRQALGDRARRLAKREYTWEASSRALINFIETEFDLT
ncbi:glycosyltransferase [Halobaculum gomorrense]|nr:glycosyltransferase [Halobaculum gomorrense]